MLAPICTVGPSRPSTRPEPSATSPADELHRQDAGPRRTYLPAVHGLHPLHAASGSLRRPSHEQPRERRACGDSHDDKE